MAKVFYNSKGMRYGSTSPRRRSRKYGKKRKSSIWYKVKSWVSFIAILVTLGLVFKVSKQS